MASTKTNSKTKPKPNKPYPTFPLTVHPNGQWCKKIRGKVHFFGVWADPRGALEEYTRQASDLHAGRAPDRGREGEPTVKDAGNSYLATQEAKVKRDLITPAWFHDCLSSVRDFAGFVGKHRVVSDLRARDFEQYRLSLYDRLGVCAIDRMITIVRAMFKYAYETDLIDRPVKYGGQFDKPSAKERRQNRIHRDRTNGKRLFTRKEILTLLKNAQQPLRAMILLGINGGFGNTDCATLPLTAMNLRSRVIDYERPKTAMRRVVPLWPETVTALREVLNGNRPRASRPEYEELVFLTVFGNPWKKLSLKEPDGDTNGPCSVGRQSAINLQFGKLVKRLKMQRHGRGFYALRHTFRTLADEVRDQHAIHRIMGHAIPGMSGVYVQDITIARLRAVVNHVHTQLFVTR